MNRRSFMQRALAFVGAAVVTPFAARPARSATGWWDVEIRQEVMQEVMFLRRALSGGLEEWRRVLTPVPYESGVKHEWSAWRFVREHEMPRFEKLRWEKSRRIVE